MICQKCKRKFRNPLALSNGDIVCPICKEKLASYEDELEVNLSNKEYYILGKTNYIESLQPKSSSLREYNKKVEKAYDMFAKAALLRHPKAYWWLAYLLCHDYLNEIVECRYIRIRMAYTYLTAILNCKKEFLNGNLTIDMEKLKEDAKELLQEIIEKYGYMLPLDVPEKRVKRYINLFTSIDDSDSNPLFMSIKLNKYEATHIFLNNGVFKNLKDQGIIVEMKSPIVSEGRETSTDIRAIIALIEASVTEKDVEDKLNNEYKDEDDRCTFLIYNSEAKTKNLFYLSKRIRKEVEKIMNRNVDLATRFSPASAEEERIITESDLFYACSSKKDMISYIME